MSRRPSISIHNYPEHLNPFNDADDDSPPSEPIPPRTKIETVDRSNREGKHKFWTFGRSKRKPRSNSFSIKSTWNGLFGKRKDSDEVEIRKPAIPTVSSTYKRGTYNGYPVGQGQVPAERREFDGGLGTLARRRKYTMDETSSRFGSTLTVYGDPGRIYEGSPQETSTSILGDLTPRPPARRFGQVTPNPTEKIPPLDYGSGDRRRSKVDETSPGGGEPIPPKRGGARASRRSLEPASHPNEIVSQRNGGTSIRTDENENLPVEDYVFKRCAQDPTRQSNLSISSCISVGSTASAYGRKKRRAPLPPSHLLKQPAQPQRSDEGKSSESAKQIPELQIVEPIDIARVTENIDEMTKRSRELDDFSVEPPSISQKTEEATKKAEDESISPSQENRRKSVECNISSGSTGDDRTAEKINEEPTGKIDLELEETKIDVDSEKTKNPTNPETEEDNNREKSAESDKRINEETSDKIAEVISEKINDEMSEKIIEEGDKKIDEKINEETKADVTGTENRTLERRKSVGNLSRSDSFSVKEEIEKIERQIKILESRSSETCESPREKDCPELVGARSSLRETRQRFFRNMIDNDRVKIQLGELPTEQRDIAIVRLEESPTPPVKIVQLHISEPIRHRPITLPAEPEAVNPIPKPRRHSNLELEIREDALIAREERNSERETRNDGTRAGSL